MDSKITKQRLSKLLSYDWLKMLFCVALAIIIWTLVFSFTSTKITNTQEFITFSYSANETVSKDFYRLMDDAKENTFSYEVMKAEMVDLNNKGNSSTYFQSYLEAGMGDLLFVPNIDNPSSKKENEDGTFSYTKHPQEFLNSWFIRVQSVDEFLADMRAYVAQYYTQSGALDKAKVEEDFRKHVKENNDKRFKGKKNFENGLLQEYARIEKYAAALTEFQGYLDAKLVEFVEMEVLGKNGEVYRENANFAINLCPDTATMGELNDFLCYYSFANTSLTAQDMCVMFFDLPYNNDNYRYESLLFVNRLIAEARARTLAK